MKAYVVKMARQLRVVISKQLSKSEHVILQELSIVFHEKVSNVVLYKQLQATKCLE